MPTPTAPRAPSSPPPPPSPPSPAPAALKTRRSSGFCGITQIDITANMNSSVDYSDDIEQQDSDCEDLTELSKKLESLVANNEKKKHRIEQSRKMQMQNSVKSSKIEVVTNVCLTAVVVGAMVKKKRGSGVSEAVKNVAKSL